MSEELPITQWLTGLADGDEEAAQRIWEAFCPRLLAAARKKLVGSPCRVADEEDAVVSAFHTFCRRAAAGQFPQLRDRDDLWRLLVTITARKAGAQLRLQRYQKRGGGTVRGESVFLAVDPDGAGAGIDQMLGGDPSPALEAAATEQCVRLLGMLDESLRPVALYKLEGYSNEEIAALLGCVTSTVERKLARIRKTWNREAVE